MEGVDVLGLLKGMNTWSFGFLVTSVDSIVFTASIYMSPLLLLILWTFYSDIVSGTEHFTICMLSTRHTCPR